MLDGDVNTTHIYNTSVPLAARLAWFEPCKSRSCNQLSSQEQETKFLFSPTLLSVPRKILQLLRTVENENLILWSWD